MNIRRSVITSALAAVALLLSAAPAVAQNITPNAPPSPNPGTVLKVTVNISRWEGDKKVGNSPYVLMVVPSWGEVAARNSDGQRTSLQMGSEFPLPLGADGKVSYKTLGTNIMVAAYPVDNGKYNVMVSVQDTQVDRPKPGQGGLPSFQNFRADNRLVMADGQTIQYTVATDSVTGQIVKLDVTMNVVK